MTSKENYQPRTIIKNTTFVELSENDKLRNKKISKRVLFFSLFVILVITIMFSIDKWIAKIAFMNKFSLVFYLIILFFIGAIFSLGLIGYSFVLKYRIFIVIFFGIGGVILSIFSSIYSKKEKKIKKKDEQKFRKSAAFGISAAISFFIALSMLLIIPMFFKTPKTITIESRE